MKKKQNNNNKRKATKNDSQGEKGKNVNMVANDTKTFLNVEAKFG